jgi:hypothetical protein
VKTAKKKKSKKANKNMTKPDDKMSKIIGSTLGIQGKSSLTHQNPFLLEEIHKLCKQITEGTPKTAKDIGSPDEMEFTPMSNQAVADTICEALQEKNVSRVGSLL